MDDITAGTVDEVLARVGSDATHADAVLEAEQAKDDGGRSTLIDALQRIVDGDSSDGPPGDDAGADAVGPEVFDAPGAADSSDVEGDDSDAAVGPEVFRVKR